MKLEIDKRNIGIRIWFKEPKFYGYKKIECFEFLLFPIKFEGIRWYHYLGFPYRRQINKPSIKPVIKDDEQT